MEKVRIDSADDDNDNDENDKCGYHLLELSKRH